MDVIIPSAQATFALPPRSESRAFWRQLSPHNFGAPLTRDLR